MKPMNTLDTEAKLLPHGSGSSIIEAFRIKIIELASAEDFGIAQLVIIERLASAGRNALQAVHGEMPKRGTNGQSIISNLTGYYADSVGGGPAIPVPDVVNQTETYGTAALRELKTMVNKIGDRRRTRMTVLRELALARKEGIDDVAAELKQELEDMKAIDARFDGSAPGIVAAAGGAS